MSQVSRPQACAPAVGVCRVGEVAFKFSCSGRAMRQLRRSTRCGCLRHARHGLVFNSSGCQFGDTKMRRCSFVLAALLVCNGLVFAQSESEIRDRIVGTWKLVSTEETLKDGTTRSYSEYGPNGKGFLMYSRDGYMCADLVNPDRPKWGSPSKPTTDEKIAAAPV